MNITFNQHEISPYQGLTYAIISIMHDISQPIHFDENLIISYLQKTSLIKLNRRNFLARSNRLAFGLELNNSLKQANLNAPFVLLMRLTPVAFKKRMLSNRINALFHNHIT